jgi:hypothetical protein
MRRLVPVVVGLLVIPFSRSLHAQPDAPRVRIIEELRLDATAEDFPRVAQVYVGPRRQIVVPIQTDQQLRVYDAAGKRLAAFGRRGAGPGEFFHMSFVGWSGDSIWVGDIRQRRTTFIGPDYKLIRTEIWPQSDRREGETARISAFDPLALLPDGSWLGQAVIWSANRDGYRSILAVRSPTGSMRTVLAMNFETDPRMMWIAGFGRDVPFSLQPQYSFAYDGSRVAELTAPMPSAETSFFAVTVYRASGDTAFTRRYPFRGVPIPKRVADSALAAMIPAAGRATEGPADLPQRFQAMARERMSSWYIPVETITLGLDQTIWVGMRPTEEGRLYLVLNNRGDPVASMLLPRTSRLRQATATQVWVTETDNDGLTSVVRYRVQGLSCGTVRC